MRTIKWDQWTAESPYTINGMFVPHSLMEGIRNWVEDGIWPGHFLTAVITNNLLSAVRRGDVINQQNLGAIVSFFFNELPDACWGSQETADHWSQIHDERHRAEAMERRI